MKLQPICIFSIVMCLGSARAEETSGFDYDDCVLKAMQGVTSDIAARAIVESCASKYPRVARQRPVSRLLLPDELAAISIRGAPQGRFGYDGTVSNGNQRLVLTEVKIAVKTTTGGQTDTYLSVVKLKLEPNHEADFGVMACCFGEGTNHAVQVEAARGYDITDR